MEPTMKVMLVFLAAWLCSRAVSKKMIPVLRFEKVENCPGKPADYYNDKTEAMNVTISQISRKLQVVNGVVIFRNSATRPKVKFQIARCQSRLMSTCEHFMTFKLNFCDVISTQSFALITESIKSFHPNLSCPFKDGNYELRNVTIDANLFSDFFKAVPDVDTFFWIIKTLFLGSNEKENSCMMAMVKIDYIRKRKD